MRDNMAKSVFFFIMIFCFVSELSALSPSEVRRIKTINENGKQYFKDKDYSRAVAQFRNALNLNPASNTLKANLAQSLIGEAIFEKNKGNVSKSIALLKEAIGLDDTIADAHIILAACYLEIGDYTGAKGELEIARIFAPGRASIHTMLGEIYFQEGDMENALECWSKTKEQQPYNENIGRKIEQAQREWTLLKNFSTKSAHPFVIMYEPQNEHLVRQAVDICSDAYMEVGKIFNHYPLSRITIIFYAPGQFLDITSAPNSVAGLYDGKIRIKCSERTNDPRQLRKLLFHEYTHVLVKYLTNDECPFWLNEGLAQAVSGPVTDIDLEILANLELENDLFHIKNMGRFAGVTHVLDHELDSSLAVKIAYIKSLITTNYMINTYGMNRCMRLLEELRTRTPIEVAVQKAIGISVEELDSQVMSLISKTKDELLSVLNKQDNSAGDIQQ